jgi:hypothetical protein
MVRLGKMVQTLRTTNGRPYEMVIFEKIDLTQSSNEVCTINKVGHKRFVSYDGFCSTEIVNCSL